MKLYPAIDLLQGACVRLYQGDYDQQTTYADDPVAQAEAFIAEGAEILHVVDLDAAKTGEPTNRPAIGAICEALDVPVQVGGGVRSAEAAMALFELGVDRVVIGTAAIENPDLVAELAGRGLSIVVGIDARGDNVATHGWTTDSGQTVRDLAARFADAGVKALVVTEISRDGTLEGPDVDGLSGAVVDHRGPDHRLRWGRNARPPRNAVKGGDPGRPPIGRGHRRASALRAEVLGWPGLTGRPG